MLCRTETILLGKNEIGKFMIRVAKQAEPDVSDGKKIANHTVRKTTIGQLINNNVPESLIIQHSGHWRVEFLSSYKAPSFSYQRQMSHYLSHSTQSQKKPAAPETSPACVQSTPMSGFRPVQYHVAPHLRSSVTDPSTKSFSTDEVSSITKPQMSTTMPAMFDSA